MTDDEFVARVASQNLPDGFGHEAHARLAWTLLRRHGLGGAGDVMSRMLRRIAESNGTPDVYHETITWAFLLLINSRLTETDATAAGWDAFAEVNADLLAWPSPVLHRWWSPELLASEPARRTVALPDRALPNVPS